MSLQATDLLVIHRPGPGNGTLYSCPVGSFSVDTELATELSAGIVRLATVEEVIVGNNNQLAISPSNLNLALSSQDYIFDGNSGAGDDDYNDSVTVFTPDTSPNTVPDASETEAGIVRLATAAETEEGTITNAAITPAGLKGMFDSPTYIVDGGVTQIDENNWDYAPG